MGFDFNFRLAEDMSDIRKLEKFLLAQSLGYKHYSDWVVGKVSPEIESGYKKAILGLSDGFLVADLILQPHKDFPDFYELKNLRVHPKLQGRYFGAFMLRQGEDEARKGNYKAIICDTRSDQIPVISLLKLMGSEELLRVPLYNKNVEDIVFIKKFERIDGGIFAPIRQKIIASAA